MSRKKGGPPVVALLNTNDDTVEMLRAMLESEGMVAVSASHANASCTVPALPSKKSLALRCTLASKKARARLSSSTTITPQRRAVPGSGASIIMGLA